MAWRVNRKAGRERPFRPRLGGCLLWILILIAILRKNYGKGRYALRMTAPKVQAEL